MQLESSVTLFDDDKVESRFAELQITADGIISEVGRKVGNDEIISRIRQSPEDIKIQAERVDIEGAAIFTSGRLSTNSLNNAYDTKGSATGAVNGLKNDLSSSTGTTVIHGGHIETGTLSANAVNASSGTFNTANIPNLSADKINAGTISINVLPSEAKNSTYITDITGGGIKVHEAGDVNNFAKITSDGMGVYKNNVLLAKFESNGAQIGQDNSTHIEMDDRSLQLKDSSGNTYFWVSDLRDENNELEWSDTFKGDGTSKYFSLSLTATNTNYTVSVSDSSGGTISKSTAGVTFTSAPTNGATITVNYITASIYAKAYSLGLRASNGSVAPMSVCSGIRCEASGLSSSAEGERTKATGKRAHAEGYYNEARGGQSHAEGEETEAFGTGSHSEGVETHAYGPYSHAEGVGTIAGRNVVGTGSEEGWGAHAEGWGTHALGLSSHAEGDSSEAIGNYSHAQNFNTLAEYDKQTAIGYYNKNLSDDIFEVGNGTSSKRSNAMEVDKNGNVVIAGRLTQSSDRRLKEHIAYLGEDAEEFIRNLKPAHFIKGEENHVGFYAQDVEKEDKWNCMTGEMNGYMTLGYTELIAPLVTYCQKLELRIVQLENKLKEER